MINFNTTSLRDIVVHIRHLLTIEDNEGIVAHGTDDCNKLDRCLDILEQTEGGKELIIREEKFWNALEQFLTPIDYQLNQYVEEDYLSSKDFDQAEMTHTDLLRMDPSYDAAFSLLPIDEDGDFINNPIGNTYGFIWYESHLAMLIEVLNSPESKKHASFLNIESERIEVLLCWHSVEQAAHSEEYRHTLLELRSLRYFLGNVYAILIMHLFPDCPREREIRYIDPRSVVYPILEKKLLLAWMMEFSYNDLSHDTFEKQITSNYAADIDERKDDFFLKDLAKKLPEYRTTLQVLRACSSWKQFLDSEERWYRNAEMILQCFRHVGTSFYLEDSDGQEKIQGDDRYDAAGELWELLTTDEYWGMAGIVRGSIPGTDMWEEMSSQFTSMQHRKYLADIQALEYFEAAVEADVESREICDEVFGNVEVLKQLRDARKTLTKGITTIDRYKQQTRSDQT